MSQVPQYLIDRVDQVITDCISVAEAHYKHKFARPHVLYDLTGTTAGTASFYNWQIRLHPGFLTKYAEEFIMDTVPHEFAHLVADQMYPPDYHKLAEGGKREIHGPAWREVMGVLGAEPTRTHEYDTAEYAKPKSKYEYYCPNCNAMSVFGATQHNVQQGPARSKFYCTQCYVAGVQSTMYLFQFRRSLGKLRYKEAIAAAKGLREVGPEAKFQLKMKAPTGRTKMAKCWEYYLNYCHEYDRQMIISLFVHECDCTPQGAATYYSNCKKLYDNGVR